MRADVQLAAGLAAAALVLYLATVCRTIYWGDSVEFAVVCPTLDIAHPTGYPTFTLLGKLLTLLPVGSEAFRVNLLGALPAAVCVGLVFLIGRAAGLSAGPAAFGAALLGVSKELWEQATAAEVYALHAALTAGCLLAAMSFARQPSRARLALLAALAGLAFTNHLTTLWNLPALAWLVFCDWRPWRRVAAPPLRRPSLAEPGLAEPIAGGSSTPVEWQPAAREWLQIAGVFLAGLVPYLYLPVRSWQGVLFNHGEPDTVGRLWYHLTGAQFRYRMFTDPEAGLLKEVGAFWERFSAQFTPWLLPLVFLGLVAAFMRSRRFAAALALLAGANLLWDLNYHIPDKDGYFLTVYLAAALFAAEGLALAASMALRTVPPQRRTSPVLAVVLVALLAPPAAVNHALVDKSDNRSLPEYTEELLRRLPPGGLLLVDDQFLIWSVAHAQLREGRFTDRMVVNDYLLCLPWYIHHLRRRYPHLNLPPRVDELVRERGEKVASARGWEIGDISQRYIELIARVIVEANLDRPGGRRVFWNWHDSEERKAWQELPLANHGLFYEVLRTAPAVAAPWTFDYPEPARYRKPDLEDAHHRHVAETFSVACNRAGIALIAAGRYAEADAAFQRALAYNPDYPQVHLNLGVLFHTYAPDRPRRDQHWSEFLRMAPDDPQAQTVRKELGGAPVASRQ